MNFYPFHIGDYISHTSHLNDAEDLAYRRMIDLYYQGEVPLPQDVQWIARKVKSTKAIVEVLLQEFFAFDEVNGCWRNNRADEEIAKYHAKANSARKANEVRWSKNLKSDVKSDAVHILTKNHEPITNNQEPIKNIITPEGVSETVFKDFVKLRKGLKAPVTETAIKGLAREGEKAGLTLQEVMELCCQNGWRGFKADWLKKDEKRSAGDKNRDVMSGLTRGLIGGNKNVGLLGK